MIDFDAAFWLSMILAVTGCTGMVLAGRGMWQGWALGLATQPIWAAFAVVSEGYGLLLTCLMYGTVYYRNLAKWRRQRVVDGIEPEVEILGPNPLMRASVCAIDPGTFVRIVIDHEDQDHVDYHEWVTNNDRVKIDSRLRPNPRMLDAQGERWVCNNVDCAGLAFVLIDQLVSAAIFQVEISRV